MSRTVIPAAAVMLVLATGCGGSDNPSEPAGDADPYEVYLEIAPDGALDLSREDAQTRAYLGCGHRFAPGTVDAALAEAYAELLCG
ncbi:MAG: hypothetical protein ACREF4_22360 [Gammaproteobacteria bacterium]